MKGKRKQKFLAIILAAMMTLSMTVNPRLLVNAEGIGESQEMTEVTESVEEAEVTEETAEEEIGEETQAAAADETFDGTLENLSMTVADAIAVLAAPKTVDEAEDAIGSSADELSYVSSTDKQRAVKMVVDYVKKHGAYISSTGEYRWTVDVLEDQMLATEITYKGSTLNLIASYSYEGVSGRGGFQYDVNNGTIINSRFYVDVDAPDLPDFRLESNNFTFNDYEGKVLKVTSSDYRELVGNPYADSILTDSKEIVMTAIDTVPYVFLDLEIGNLGFYNYDAMRLPEPIVEKPLTNCVKSVNYRTHVQSYGWQSFVSDGMMAGTSGESKRIEGIEIKLDGISGVGIQYTTHCQSYGWIPWSRDGEMNGTEGESKRLEAIKIQLTGKNAGDYDVWYRVHAQNYGWLGWAKNGEVAGTLGLSKRLEGIQIVVKKRNTGNPGAANGHESVTTDSVKTASGMSKSAYVAGENATHIAARTHVQSYGWQGWKFNGAMSGTSGESKRLEGIRIKLTNQQYSGSIEYRTHVQRYGWMDWKRDGAMSGTSGESKRLEAIQIRLTGELAQHYDVYYRVHAQRFGWLGWAKNGEYAGTAGYSYRLESIQIVLVPKGSGAPSNTFAGVTGNAKIAAYKQK